MSDFEDGQLDTLMRRHLSAELDGQRGRAEAAFLRHVATAAAADNAVARPTRFGPPGPQERNGQPFMRFRGRLLTLVGTALAASIAGLWATPSIFHTPASSSHPTPTE